MGKTIVNISRFSIMAVLPLFVVSTVFADLSEESFDSSNCITISDGSMKEVSIPLPSGWKNAFKNQKMSDEVHQRYEKMKFLVIDDIVANYYNPKKRTEYIEIVRLEKKKSVSVPYGEFKKLKGEAVQSVSDGSLKSDILNKHPDDKEMGKRFQIFSVHEQDDHSFQFTEVGLTLNNTSIVFAVGTVAVIWIHERMFSISVWTTASNKNKTMDKMTETRFFMSHWVEAILQENGCEANDITEKTDTTAETETIVTTDTEPSNDEKIARQDIDESIASDDADDEAEPSKPSVVSFLEKLKSKALSITKREKQEDDTSLENDDKPSKWHQRFLAKWRQRFF